MKRETMLLQVFRETVGDLDPQLHVGLTVGHGLILFDDLKWHANGNATAYPSEDGHGLRWLDAGDMITLHHK